MQSAKLLKKPHGNRFLIEVGRQRELRRTNHGSLLSGEHGMSGLGAIRKLANMTSVVSRPRNQTKTPESKSSRAFFRSTGELTRLIVGNRISRAWL